MIRAGKTALSVIFIGRLTPVDVILTDNRVDKIGRRFRFD